MRITRFSHVNINCRALTRSRPFYEDVLGLTPTVRTAPAAQDGTAFALGKRIVWDAWILHDPRGFPAVGLDLLEWLEPKPVGAPATMPHQLGFSTLRLLTDHLDQVHSRCTRARVAGLTPITTGRTDSSTVARRFRCQDPDGTLVEVADGDALRIAHLTTNTSDLARARAFYHDVLQLPPGGPSDPVFHDGERVGMAPAMLSSTMVADPRGADHFALQIVRWSRPRSLGTPPAFAHQLGLYRLAFIVENIGAAHAHLLSHGARPLSRPVDLDVGEGLPRLKVFLCPDPDGTMLEFIEDPII